MGLLNSRLTARRFLISEPLPDGWRELYRDNLENHAFTEPPYSSTSKAAIQGWTLIDNMLATDFSDINGWIVDSWILLALRVDKKSLPAKKLKAELVRRCALWTEEHAVARCPVSVRTEIKDAIEAEWLPRVIPSTQMHELAWNLDNGHVYFSSPSEIVGDTVRKLFYRTFGQRLRVHSPLNWLAEGELFQALLHAQPIPIHDVGNGQDQDPEEVSDG